MMLYQQVDIIIIINILPDKNRSMLEIHIREQYCLDMINCFSLQCFFYINIFNVFCVNVSYQDFTKIYKKKGSRYLLMMIQKPIHNDIEVNFFLSLLSYVSFIY